MNLIHRQYQLVRYATTTTIAVGALLLKLLLASAFSRDIPEILFFTTGMISALMYGVGPGLWTICLCTVCNEFFFMAPYGSWRLNSTEQAIHLGLFFCEATIICVICGRLRSAQVATNHALQRARMGEEAARSLQERVLNVADHERNRLSHDLHDGLGQQLAAISLMTRSLEQRLAALSPHEATEAADITDLVKVAMTWTHDLCRTLSPAQESTDDLSQMLHELADKTSRMFRINCKLECKPYDVCLSPVVTTQLYRITQEAISNAVRHGKAHSIDIRLDANVNALQLVIADDGAGIGHVKPSDEGMGLRIMRYRTEMIGAHFEVNQRPEGGTAVVCRRQNSSLMPESPHAGC